MKHKAKISRYENSHRLPLLRTALAYATILDVPLPKLFPDLQREVQAEVAGRILELRTKLAAAEKRERRSRRAARMIERLDERYAQITNAISSS